MRDDVWGLWAIIVVERGDCVACYLFGISPNHVRNVVERVVVLTCHSVYHILPHEMLKGFEVCGLYI